MESLKTNDVETIVTLWIPPNKFQYVHNFVERLGGKYRGKPTKSMVGKHEKIHMRISFASYEISNVFRRVVGIINQPFF